MSGMYLIIDAVIALVVILLTMLVVFLRNRHSKEVRYIAAMHESMVVRGLGVVTFDKRHRISTVSDVAQLQLPFLASKQDCANFKEFIAHMFDHALDDNNAKTYHNSLAELSSDKSLFREIILGADNEPVLVDIQSLDNGDRFALIKNVAKLKQKQDDIVKLNTLNMRLKMAIEASPYCVSLVDVETPGYSLIYLNESARQLAGFGDEEIVGLTLKRVLQPLFDEGHFNKILDAVDRRVQYQKEINVEVAGESRWYDFRLSPVINETGRAEFYVCIAQDVTMLKTREAEFFKAQRLEALGQLSAGIAHDFNNILSIVEGYARMIAMNTGDHEKVSVFSEKIKEASKRAAGLTRQMMTFGRHEVVLDGVSDIVEILTEQEVLLKPLLSESIALTVHVPADPLYVHCSAENVVQIVMNLVINARDAVEDDSEITVMLQALDDDNLPDFLNENNDGDNHSYVCLQVMDNGSGIEAGIQERIFDPFFTTKTQDKGSGMGLSVIYGLINNMGGYIDVHSKVGEGATFSVYIPRCHDAPQKTLQSRGFLSETDLFSLLTVLVVEDEPELNSLMCSVLSERGMNVLSANCGDDALVVQDDFTEENPSLKIDLLITDIVMPGINGVKLAEMIVSISPETKVICMSGYPADRQDVDGKDQIILPDGARFLAKPLDYDHLCDVVMELFLVEENPNKEGA